MLLASLALLAVAVCGAMVGLAARGLLRADDELQAVRRSEVRHRAWSAERARMLDVRSTIAKARRRISGLDRPAEDE